MKKLYWFIKFVFYSSVLLSVLAAAGIYTIFWKFSKDLPKLDSLKDYTPHVISEVYDNQGNKIGEFWKERRILLEPDEIPQLITKALIASEDDRFLEHSGIDYLGIARAMIENLKAGHVVQGGSTITQQVVKSLILTKEKTYERKIKEAILAKRLEDKFSKSEILYLYLNQVFFGNRAYGIEAAAQNYFHKSAKELSIAESAMLAGLVKAPYSYSPVRNIKRAKERQLYVLKRMLEEKFITKEQYDRAHYQKLTFYRAPTDKQFNKRYAPWFVEEVRRMLIKKYGENAIYTHGLKVYTTLDQKAQKAADHAVMRGLTEIHKRHGYYGPKKHLQPSEFKPFLMKAHKKIYRENLDPDLIIYDPLEVVWERKAIPQDGKIYQALITNVTSNKITVQVGNNIGYITVKGYGWARSRNNRARGYEDVIYLRNAEKRFKVGDVIQVKIDKRKHKTYKDGQTYFTLEETPRIEGALFSYDPQLGYVKAIVGGKDFGKSEFNRATQAYRQTGSIFKPFLYASALDKGYLEDTIIEDTPIKIPDGPNRFWEPKNYGGGYKGPMTFRSALIASRNIISVKIILDVGTDYVTGFVRKLGITSPIAKVYSMSLGSNDMKLMEVARAFGVFPNYGILPELIFVKKVTNRFGQTLEEKLPKRVVPFYEQIENGTHSYQMISSVDDGNIRDAVREDLYDDALSWMSKDNLVLTPIEKLILYGRYIPDGYTISPRTASRMVDIMQGIVQYGTATRVRALKRPAAGKTGTTNDQTDCWFVGYVPDLVAGVWVGYDKNINKVGGGETGGKAASPIFLYYMKEYLKGTPVKKFEHPKLINHSALDLPIDVYPSDIHELFVDPYNSGSGGADFFIDDI